MDVEDAQRLEGCCELDAGSAEWCADFDAVGCYWGGMFLAVFVVDGFSVVAGFTCNILGRELMEFVVGMSEP